MYHKVIFSLLLILAMQPLYALADSDVWDLEVSFEYAENDKLTKSQLEQEPMVDGLTTTPIARQKVTMTVCNPTDKNINFIDYVGLSKANFFVVFEIKDSNGKRFIEHDDVQDFINVSYEENIVTLSSGECKNYIQEASGALMGNYMKKVWQHMGMRHNEKTNHLSDILNAEDLEAMTPASFKINVTFFSIAHDKAKKGATFQSKWFDISGFPVSVVKDNYMNYLKNEAKEAP